MSDDELTRARIQTVRDHMRPETSTTWDAVIATFEHPRYEPQRRRDGGRRRGAAVRAIRRKARARRFPTRATRWIAIDAGDDCVFVEFRLTGTHLGPLQTPAGVVEATGRTFRGRS